MAEVTDCSPEHPQRRIPEWHSRRSRSSSSASRAPISLQTNERIRSQLPFLQAVLPQGIKTTVVLDRTTTIRASVNNVEQTLIISVVLVILVVFVFLRNWRATLIPSVAVPVSLIGTFAVMYLFGYSLDNLSLMALTISTGFVVDDAIVVMENISRHLEMGMAPLAAALKGAEEIGFTVFTISMSLIAVFIPHPDDGRHRRPPLPRIRGDALHRHPRLHGDFAHHDADDVRASAEGSTSSEKHGALYRASEKFFNGMLATYRHSPALGAG